MDFVFSLNVSCFLENEYNEEFGWFLGECFGESQCFHCIEETLVIFMSCIIRESTTDLETKVYDKG